MIRKLFLLLVLCLLSTNKIEAIDFQELCALVAQSPEEASQLLTGLKIEELWVLSGLAFLYSVDENFYQAYCIVEHPDGSRTYHPDKYWEIDAAHAKICQAIEACR